MTLPIIIRASQNGWTGTTRKPIPVQPSAYGVAALFQYAGRIRAILGADVFARVRGVSGIGARNPGRHAPIQSAATSTLRGVIAAMSSRGGVAAGALSALCTPLRLFLSNLFGGFTALRAGLFGIHLTPTVLQNTKRSWANPGHVVRSFRDGSDTMEPSKGMSVACAEKFSRRSRN